MNKFKRNILVLLMLGFFMPSLQGCSLLKIASQPFKNTVSKVPEKTEKAERRIRCKGEIALDASGRVLSCSDNYDFREKTFNQEERKLTIREKIAQFVLNAQGYLLWFVIIAVVLSFSGFGWVISGIFSTLRGAGKATRDFVKGIQNGKKYVRQNGHKYTDKEREAYLQGAEDLMERIGSSQSKVTKKIVGNIKADISSKE